MENGTQTTFVSLIVQFWNEFIGFFKYIFNDVFLGREP